MRRNNKKPVNAVLISVILHIVLFGLLFLASLMPATIDAMGGGEGDGDVIGAVMVDTGAASQEWGRIQKQKKGDSDKAKVEPEPVVEDKQVEDNEAELLEQQKVQQLERQKELQRQHEIERQKQQQEKAKQEALERQKQAEEAKAKKEAEAAKLKADAEAKRLELTAKQKAEEEAKAAALEKINAEKEREQKVADEKARKEAEAREKAAKDQAQKAAAEREAKLQAEEKVKAEAKAKELVRKESAEKAKKVAEAKAKADAAKRKAEQAALDDLLNGGEVGGGSATKGGNINQQGAKGLGAGQGTGDGGKTGSAYNGVIKRSIRPHLQGDRASLRGKTCDIRIALAKDGTILSYTRVNGSDYICSVAMKALGQTRKMLSPPNAADYDIFQNFIFTFDLSRF